MRTCAFILCGGRATRLKGLNKHQPKALTKIQGRSLLSILIENIATRVDEIYISHAGQKETYLNALETELSNVLLNKLQFVLDDVQQGTALAVRDFEILTDNHFCVLNGDTIYNDYEDIFPDVIHPNEVIFSTSVQTIGTGGVISVNKITKQLHYEKNRDDINLGSGEITNGVISLGCNVMKTLGGVEINQGKSIEKFLLENQNNNELSFRLHQTRARFLDIGIPETFNHVDMKYQRLISEA